MKKVVVRILAIALSVVTLTGCGTENAFIGTYGGTSTGGRKVEIVINENNTVIYIKGSEINEGVWSEHGDHSLELDFGGKVSSKSEPLIVTLSSDGNELTVEGSSSSWKPDHYQRR